MTAHHASPGRTLITAAEIRNRVGELGRQISSDCDGTDLLALAVLRGSFVFAADLVRRLEPSVRVHIDFIRAASYGDGTTSRGTVELGGEIQSPVEGRPVLIIEDIVETGRTLRRIQDTLRSLGAATVRTVTLLDKEVPRAEEFPVEYIGFGIPDVFVVGYGLDHAQMYRHLPDIHVLDPVPGDSGTTS